MKSFVILLLCFVQVTQQLQWQRLAEDVESKSETKMILITCHFMSIRGFTERYEAFEKQSYSVECDCLVFDIENIGLPQLDMTLFL